MQASSQRARDFVLGISTFAVISVLAVADGGYFPKAWGVGFLLLCGIAVAIVVLPSIQLSLLELLMLASLAGLVAWTALSTLWSTDPGQSMLEVQRALLYLSGTGGLLILARRGSTFIVLAAVASACVSVSVYALAVRLYPDVFGAPPVGRFNSFPLSDPVGYSGALGLMAAMGLLLTLGVATSANGAILRGIAGAALVPLASALYFAASRAALGALAIGFAVAVASEPTRRKFVGAAVLALTLPAMSAWVSACTDALGKPGIPLDEVARAGHRLAVVLILFAAITAALVGGSLRMRRAPPLRLACLTLVVGVVLTGLGLGWVDRAGPPQLQTTSIVGDDLASRLASTSLHGRLTLWSVAWRSVKDEPLLGTGAGSFARSWLQYRPAHGEVRSAHNVYLETLSELGPLGLALLLVVLAVPLLAATRARQERLIPVAAGVWIAYIVHAAVHWDWEMPVLTLGALVCAGAILVAARRNACVLRPRRLSRIGILGAIAALCGFVFAGLVGNVAFEKAITAAAIGSTTDANAQARRAILWMPWSGEPWRLVGELARGEGNTVLARASFRQGLKQDPHNWRLWIDLASITSGQARANAVEQATRLNPHSVEVEILRSRAFFVYRCDPHDRHRCHLEVKR